LTTGARIGVIGTGWWATYARLEAAYRSASEGRTVTIGEL